MADYQHTAAAKYFGEFIGTYFLALTVGCNVLTDSIGAALSIGAMLMVMIYAIGPVSGAHLNPAVTLAVLMSTMLRPKSPGMPLAPGVAAGYVGMQLLGGMFAGATYQALFNSAFMFAPVGRYSWEQVCTVETLYTAALCYVVLNVATVKDWNPETLFETPKDANQSCGLSIGFTVTAAALAIGGISGCCLNPAVSIGAATATALHTGLRAASSYLLLYLITPLFGSILAVGLFRVVRPRATN
mmetsp:Transcript_108493/g.203672  ORF Transcript_108493/g.203672 Transcript_108493/m.203672 type:complete len:243 (-) Transcript_108493:80-808(-)